MHERDEILQAYFLHLEVPANSDHYDVVEDVDELVSSKPAEAWEILKDLIAISPSDDALAYVAAGPLESLLAVHGDEMASVIRAEALVNERLRDALARVLLDPIDAGVQRALGEWLYPSSRPLT